VLPGLDRSRRYRVEHLALPGERRGPWRTELTWLRDGIELSGAQLAASGVQLPPLHPESAILLRLSAVE
jgi:alpha-galactosidase